MGTVLLGAFFEVHTYDESLKYSMEQNIKAS